MLYLGVVVVAFLVGFIPMWVSARDAASDRDTAQAALRLSRLQNALADAAIDAGRGEYERARQSASTFFTELRAEADRGAGSALTEAQQQALAPMLDARDDIITLLARSDPSVTPRLAAFYTTFREQLQGPQPAATR